MSHQPNKWARVVVWLQALAAAAVLCGATVALELVLPDFLAESYLLRLAMAFGLAQLLAIVVVVVEVLVNKFVVRARERRVDRAAPTIRRALVTYTLGHDNWSELGRLRRHHTRGFEDCLIELLEAVEGPPRHRLGEVAQRLGLVDHWLQQLRSRSVTKRLHAIGPSGSRATRERVTPSPAPWRPITRRSARRWLMRSSGMETARTSNERSSTRRPSRPGTEPS